MGLYSADGKLHFLRRFGNRSALYIQVLHYCFTLRRQLVDAAIQLTHGFGKYNGIVHCFFRLVQQLVTYAVFPVFAAGV